MSAAEAPKPVEATQPAEEEKPVEKPVEKPEEKTEEKPEEKTEEKTEATEESKEESEPSVLKTTVKIDYKNHKNNRKFDPSTREVTDDPNSIRKQVEFYFGDWNFPQDKFMWESCGGSENRPMKIKTIHSFKRMRCFQPYSAVVAALRTSNFLVVTGEEGEEEVKRKNPYSPMPTGKAKTEAATVYVKGFGDETPHTQFDLESFFAQFGEIKGLKLRRTNEDLFKGSVFVTFTDEETAKKFLEQDPAPKWRGHDLKVMSKRAYCEEKNELIRQGKLEPNSNNPKKFYEGRDPSGTRGRGRGGRDRRGAHDPNDWKKRREHDQKNGFKDRRGGGRGRGGRGRGDRDRDGGRRDRRENGDAKYSSNDTVPRIQSTADEPKTEETNNNGKRSRDEDGAAEEPVAKKVDTKTEAATEAS